VSTSLLQRVAVGAPQLEWVDGELWGNVWQTECIARIDPKTGLIRGWILLNGLSDAARRASKGRFIDVLNGEKPNL
jgi:glutamine cyclotransferase